MIEVYWGWSSKDHDEIIVCNKKYYDKLGWLAEQPNGQYGRVEKWSKKEPYNYYSEINDALMEIGPYEACETLFNLNGTDIINVITKMRSYGFEFIYNKELDNTVDCDEDEDDDFEYDYESDDEEDENSYDYLVDFCDEDYEFYLKMVSNKK